jgi:hypothetical protein
MKNKKIIDSFNKVNCENKDIIFEKIFFKKRYNYKYIAILATCLIFVLFINYNPKDQQITPLTNNESEQFKMQCIEPENEECIIEKEEKE